MSRTKYSLGNIMELVLPTLVLALLLLFTYAKFFKHPYMGFRASTPGSVVDIFVQQDQEPSLELNDRIVKLDSLRWGDYESDNRKLLFEDAKPGDVITLVVERAGREITIHRIYPGPNQGEILDLLINEGWLGFVFWLCGTATLLALRPKDERWQLMIAFNYLTAFWLTVGSGVSFYHTWGSALLLRMSIWVCMPVYLRLHWLFPRRLTPISPALTISSYVIAGIFAVMEWFQLLPPNMYLIGFLIAILGSLLFLIAHFVFQKDARSDLQRLIIVVSLAFLPALATGIFSALLEIPGWAGVGLVGLPILPIAYLYGVYRRQLGGLEIRLNRIISIYLFLLLLGIVIVPITALTNVQESSGVDTVIVTTVFGAITTIGTILWFPAFQTFVERWLLGIRLPSKSLVENYSAHITTSVSLLDLTRVLREEILPSLLIREFVFLYSERNALKLVLLMGVAEERVPEEPDMADLQTQMGQYRSLNPGNPQPHDWIRLVLPLRFGDQTIGFWLFGRRDPDDLYTEVEIHILQSLANQTAVALSNILQAQKIKSIYEGNILRHEQERLRLAHDLHDSVLNELASLVVSDDAPILSPKLQDIYEGVTQRLREIVSDLRPPMLKFGLKLAFGGLADHLMERTHDSVQVVAQIQMDDDCRYTDIVEINLYRIVQEACQNSLRYAHAKTIQINGTLAPTSITIQVLDDGIGFVTETNLKLDEMVVNKHFGLANMLERASLINAAINIESKPQQGTQIKVVWQVKPASNL